MVDSILNTIKQMLGVSTDDTAFDVDIITNINSAFMVLNQLGVGPTTVYSINDATSVWADFLTDPTMYSLAKTYIYMKTKLAFDPPSTSFVLEAYKGQISEFEWRLSVQVPIPPEPEV